MGNRANMHDGGSLITAIEDMDYMPISMQGEVVEIGPEPSSSGSVRFFTLRYFIERKDRNGEASLEKRIQCKIAESYFQMCVNKYGKDLQVGDYVLVEGNLNIYTTQPVPIQLFVQYYKVIANTESRIELQHLEEEFEGRGAFKDVNKRPLPRNPKTIGIITSSRAAAVQDVLQKITEENPLIRILFSCASVQANVQAHADEGTKKQQYERIAEGLKEAIDKIKDEVDLILLVRGGGDPEWLMPFNERILAEAMIACETPIVTGIGHAHDVTIAERLADYGAYTPTDAAIVVNKLLSNAS